MSFIKRLKGTKIAGFFKQSAGNVWYPVIAFSWWLSKKLVPRRTVNFDTFRFSLSCTNWITHFRWYTFKTKEPETIYFLDNYLKEKDTFVDIGANVGVFSIYAAKRFKSINVISFEPEASNLAILKQNIVENNLTDKIIIYGVGLSDRVGLSKLHLQDFTSGAALHSESNVSIERSVEGGNPILWAEGIYTVTLDYFREHLEVFPNVLKIDTDGSEYKILLGAKELLRNPELRAIIIEMPVYQFEECKSILEDSGFIKTEHDFPNTRNEIWTK
jgi:FkbM family methyltransferase